MEVVTEARASYFRLMQERLHIELWDKETFSLNRFIGYFSIPLVDIANGSFRQEVQIQESIDNGKAFKPAANLTFYIFFEEKWDFYLTFMDWKTTSLEKEKNKNMGINPSIELRILSSKAMKP